MAVGQTYQTPWPSRRDVPPLSLLQKVWRGSTCGGHPCGTRAATTYPPNIFTESCALSFTVCEPRTVVRVRVRSIVVRIRVRHAAIRVRVVVRPLNHTGSLQVSACFLFCADGAGGLCCPPFRVGPAAYNALNALTLSASTMSPLKASREPKFEFVTEASALAYAYDTPPLEYE